MKTPMTRKRGPRLTTNRPDWQYRKVSVPHISGQQHSLPAVAMQINRREEAGLEIHK